MASVPVILVCVLHIRICCSTDNVLLFCSLTHTIIHHVHVYAYGTYSTDNI